MSHFVTFFLVVLILFIVYLSCGSVIRYRRGIRCFPAYLPHYYMWCSLLNLVAMILTCGRWRIWRSVPHQYGHLDDDGVPEWWHAAFGDGDLQGEKGGPYFQTSSRFAFMRQEAQEEEDDPVDDGKAMQEALFPIEDDEHPNPEEIVVVY